MDGSLTVNKVLKSSPAEALLEPYDRIVRINDEPLKGKDVKDVNKMIAGEADTDIKIKAVRGCPGL